MSKYLVKTGVRQELYKYDVDDTVVDGATTVPPSSNWAYDHSVDYGLHTKVVRKTADETVNNSDTLQNDDELLFAIGANEVWQFTIYPIINSAATPDFKYDFTVPSGGDCFIHSAERTAANASLIDGGSVGQSTATGDIRGIGQNNMMGIIHAIAVNGATAGNVQFRWAQNTANGSDTKVLTNSCIIATRIL